MFTASFDALRVSKMVELKAIEVLLTNYANFGPSKDFTSLNLRLIRVAPILECLSITFDPHSTSKFSIVDVLSMFSPDTGLAVFKSLKYLEVVENFLVSESFREKPEHAVKPKFILPSTIQTLTVFAPSGKLLSWLVELIDSASGSPALRQVELHCMSRWGRNATWFHKHGVEVFSELRKLHIHVIVRTIGCVPRYSAAREFKRIKSVWEQTPIWYEAPEQWELGRGLENYSRASTMKGRPPEPLLVIVRVAYMKWHGDRSCLDEAEIVSTWETCGNVQERSIVRFLPACDELEIGQCITYIKLTLCVE